MSSEVVDSLNVRASSVSGPDIWQRRFSLQATLVGKNILRAIFGPDVSRCQLFRALSQSMISSDDILLDGAL